MLLHEHGNSKSQHKKIREIKSTQFQLETYTNTYFFTIKKRFKHLINSYICFTMFLNNITY